MDDASVTQIRNSRLHEKCRVPSKLRTRATTNVFVSGMFIAGGFGGGSGNAILSRMEFIAG
jgi:hypothetical protein